MSVPRRVGLLARNRVYPEADHGRCVSGEALQRFFSARIKVTGSAASCAREAIVFTGSRLCSPITTCSAIRRSRASIWFPAATRAIYLQPEEQRKRFRSMASLQLRDAGYLSLRRRSDDRPTDRVFRAGFPVRCGFSAVLVLRTARRIGRGAGRRRPCSSSMTIPASGDSMREVLLAAANHERDVCGR